MAACASPTVKGRSSPDLRGGPPSSAGIAFEAHLVDHFPGAYQVSVADLNGDGRPDIVALAERPSQLAWYEGPHWQKHPVTVATDRFIDVAPADVDGDGHMDLALASQFDLKDSTSGMVHWLQQGAPDDHWTAHEVDLASSSHRLRWADVDGDGRKELIDIPLLGRGSVEPSYAVPARLVFYRPGAGRWVPEVISESLHVVHGVRIVNWEGDPADEIMTASFEGVDVHKLHRATHRWERIHLGDGNQVTRARRGASEVALGFLGGDHRQPAATDARAFVATVEPWHGHQIVIYQRAGRAWNRRVIDDSLEDAHALATVDLDGDGFDEIVAGYRGGARRLLVYRATDAGGTRWQRQIVDDGDMACAGVFVADLNQDGRPDLVAAGTGSGNVKWYENRSVPSPR